MIYTLKKKQKSPKFYLILSSSYKSNSEKVILQIPAWRPGRYELQTFLQKTFPKLRHLIKIGQNLGIQKITKDCLGNNL